MPGSTGDGIDLSEIRELEERLSKFRIDTSPDMTIRGNAWQGFALNTYTCDEIPESQGGGGHGPPIPTGACCYGTTCNVVSGVYCAITGGTYHGDGSPCSPNPCAEPSTSRCCLPDQSCVDETESDCADAGGLFIPGTSCDDSACTCCEIVGAFGPACDTGDFPDVCKAGPETCDGCAGETIPCDSLWLTRNEYCITCPGGGLVLCQTAVWNPITCELTITDISHDGCATCDGTTQSVENQYIPCSSLMGAFDDPFFQNN